MTSNDRDETTALERRAKAIFDRSVGDLDGSTRAKLARARMRATEPRARAADLFGRRGAPAWVPAGAVAAVAALWLTWQSAPDSMRPAFDVAESTDLELLLGDDELDLVEDLEFYAWLQQEGQPRNADQRLR